MDRGDGWTLVEEGFTGVVREWTDRRKRWRLEAGKATRRGREGKEKTGLAQKAETNRTYVYGVSG